jgi:hypothetical protein
MSTLAELRDLVELDLDDAGNATWSTDEVDRGIEKALRDYSQVNPQQAVGTITLSADGREVSISSLTGLTRIVKVWFPYDSSDPAHPPNWVEWSLWGSNLYLITLDEPQSGEVARVFYHKNHTINGLDGESSTTIPAYDEEVVVIGAGAYCALQKSRASVEEAGIAADTPEHWLDWAVKRLDDFNERLRQVRQRELLKLDKRVPLEANGWQRDDVDEDI